MEAPVELRFPKPNQRITRLVNLEEEKYPHVRIESKGRRESSIPGKFRTWRIDLVVDWNNYTFDLVSLVDGDEQLMESLRKKIMKRRKKVEPREVAHRILEGIKLFQWDWKFFGIRVMDRNKLGNNLSKLIHARDITVDDLPNCGTIMIFAGEEAAQQPWDLLLYAKNSIDPKNW